MNWFVSALICVIGWGTADVFYKLCNGEEDRYSHLKTAVWVGIVMGVAALIMMPMSETGFTVQSFFGKAAAYLPASLCYIISMVIGYAGLRYLELSIVSPVQNASGAFSAVCMMIYMVVTGRISAIGEEFSALDILGTLLIVTGMVAIAIAEQKENLPGPGEERFRSGALALIFPLLYCLFDTVGTAADGIILDEGSGLDLGEIDVLILYGFTFLLAGLVSWVVLLVKTGRPYMPFAGTEKHRAAAACCEEFGQVFYVYAMSGKPVLAAPMVASYCILSVCLGSVFLKERLGVKRTVWVICVIAGIVLLGVSEGLAEA